MWWWLIADRHTATSVSLAAGFALNQYPHTVGQIGYVVFLTGDNIGQIIDHTRQVGDLFFQRIYRVIAHAVTVTCQAGVKTRARLGNRVVEMIIGTRGVRFVFMRDRYEF